MDRKTGPGDDSPDRAGTQHEGSMSLLVGRTREQDSLRSELAIALSGQGRVCLIGGEAGIGKTTLVRDLARVAAEHGARTLTGSCYDLSSAPPYGPWLDLYEACVRDPALPAPPAALAGGHLAPVTDQAALFADVRRFMAALTQDGPALVILEDLHWADPASLDLLRHVGPHVRHWPVLLLITYRADELLPGRPLTQHLPALIREADATRIDLRRVDTVALRALIASRHTLPREDEDRLVAHLDRHAEGNPYFATEILRTLEADALLQREDGGWSLGALDQAIVPPLLRQVIEERVIHLGGEIRAALAIAAVIGHEVPLALWAEVADLSAEALLDTVERAVWAHLLEAERDGTRVRFAHALTREALYESILPPRRRAWHLEVAESLLATSQPDPETVALHLQAAGDTRAVEWLIAAGERAQRAYAWLTAAERFRVAADLLKRVEDAATARARRWLLIRRGNLLRFAYPGNAITALVEARELARQTDDPFLVAEAEVLLGVNYGYANQFRAGLASMERGIASIEAMPMSLQQSTNSIRSWLNLAANGNEERDSADDTAALDLFRANGVDFRRCLYCWHLASAGNLAAAAAVQDRLAGILDRDFSTRGGIRVMAAFARHGQAVLAIAAGEPDAGRRHWAIARPDFGDHHMLVAFTLLDELRDLALPYDAAHPPARRELATMAEAALGRAGGALRPGVSPKLAWLRCMVVDGRWDEVVQILDDLPDPGNCRLRRETTYARVELARHRGEPEQAWAEIRPLLPQGPATEPGDLMHQEGLYLLRLAAGLCLDAGDLPGAEAWLTAHDRWLAWSGSVLGRAEGRLAWGLYHHAVGDADRARAAAGNALALATDPDQPLVRLGAHRLLGTLDHAARRVEAAEAHLGIAMTIADACEVPFERALTLLALAELREATGAATEAVTHMAEARAIGTTLGAIAVLQHADTLAARLAGKPGSQANRFGLTSRELDVLRLLARHRTDKEIAETLFISPHTASTHVKHVLAKLGVASRRDAADIAVAHGIA